MIIAMTASNIKKSRAMTTITKRTAYLKAMTMGMMLGSGLAMSSVAIANNPPPRIKADAPNRYIVKKGDTLWDISGKFLNSPWRWKEIWAANRHVRNPNLIYPKDVLILCTIKGKTLVGIDTGEGCTGVEKAISNPSPVLQDNSVGGSIPAIPLSSIEAWLDRTIIVSPEDYRNTPYVLASKNKNIITAAGDKIYAKGVPLIIGQRYGVYREGEPYIDPTTLQVMGLEVTQVASGLVTEVSSNGVSSIELKQTFDKEVSEGDRVFIEVGNYLPPIFNPQPAHVTRGGRIIRVNDSISGAAKGNVISINLGTVQGAKPGDVLAVYQRGVLVQDNIGGQGTPVRLPNEKTGLVMVFKAFDNISYAYVLDSEMPLRIGDLLVPAQGN